MLHNKLCIFIMYYLKKIAIQLYEWTIYLLNYCKIYVYINSMELREAIFSFIRSQVFGSIKKFIKVPYSNKKKIADNSFSIFFTKEDCQICDKVQFHNRSLTTMCFSSRSTAFWFLQSVFWKKNHNIHLVKKMHVEATKHNCKKIKNMYTRGHYEKKT